MQKLFKSVDFLDKRCYEEYKLTEDILMEHAANGLYGEVVAKNPKSVFIVAGPGNNGGDGVVLARRLLGRYDVKLLMPYGAKSKMCKLQLDRFYALGGKLCKNIDEADVIVDALFGSGLSKPLRQDSIELIKKLNSLKGFKVACDIPTGIDIDGNPLPIAFKADVTVTMGALKSALLMDNAKDYVGKIKVADLGIDRELYEMPSSWFMLQRSDFLPPLRTNQNSNKGSFGHLAVIAGQKEGAAIMAGLAALRFGAGLVTVVSNEKIVVPYELMHDNKLPSKTSAIAVGMGLGYEYSDEEFKRLVIDNDLPVVIDADLFYSNKLPLLLQKEKIVLTPHPKEFSSMLSILNLAKAGVEEIQAKRLEFALLFSKAYPKAVLILKGANPIIAQNEKIFINPLGSNALAKGGSGDVLTGLVGALLAQSYEPLDAAIQASLAHTLALQKVDVANFALKPTDLIEAVAKL